MKLANYICLFLAETWIRKSWYSRKLFLPSGQDWDCADWCWSKHNPGPAAEQHHNIHNRMFPPCLTRGNTHRLLSFWYLPRTNCAYRVSEKINRILVQMAINPPKSFRNGKNLECFRKFSKNAALMSTKIVKIDGENNREPAWKAWGCESCLTSLP